MIKPTVSLCMIVKNEEDVLARCLESVKDYVDEMIIVDTGSTDQTKQIAESYGAKVYDYTWDHHFAKARNVAKEKATSDWIVQLDADEYFLEGEAKKIKEAIEQTDKMSIRIQISNFVTDNRNSTHSYARIFKNIPEIRYENAIHEQVLFNGKPMQTEESTIRIMHTGYIEETYLKKNKHERNVKLIKEELKRKPNDGYMLFNLANEYRAIGEYEKALDLYIQSHKQGESSGVLFAVIRNIITTLTKLERFDDALLVVTDAKKVYPDYTDIFYFEGELYEILRCPADAIAAYERAIEIGEANKRYLTVAGVGTIYPRERLVTLYMKERQIDKAMQCMAFLLQLNPTNPQYHVQLIQLLRRDFTETQIIDYLDEVFPSIDPKNVQLKLQICETVRLKKGILNYSEQLKIDTEALRLYENNPLFQFIMGEKEKAKHLIMEQLKQKKTTNYTTALLYYLETKDVEVKEKLKRNKTASLIVQVVDGEYELTEKKKNYDHKIYIDILRELVLGKEYDTFAQLLALENAFQPIALKQIADIFYENYNDDLAVQYYVRYLQYDKQNYQLFSTVSKLLYTMSLYDEAILFANQALSLHRQDFVSFEVLIKSYQAKDLRDMAKQTVEDAYTFYPHSTFLNDQKGVNF